MNFRWEDLEDWQKIAIAFVFLILIAGFFYLRLLKLPLKQLKETNVELEKANKKISEINQEIQAGRTLDEKFRFQMADLEKIEGLIYRENQVPEALKEVTSSSAKDLEINFYLIEPGKIESVGRYKVLPLRMSFKTDYFTMLSYFSRISQNFSFEIEEVKVAPMKNNSSLINVEMTGQIYLLPLTAAAQPAREALPDSQKTKPEEKKISNPFSSPAQESSEAASSAQAAAIPELKLSGIWKGAVTKAIINGKIVKAGDEISGCKVKQIKENAVIMDFNGQEFVLEIK